MTVLEGAVAPEGFTGSLHRTNNRNFSSLLKPNRLQEFYPNIEVSDEFSVSLLTLEQALEGCSPRQDGRMLLVAELAGLETAVLQEQSAELLRRFDWVFVRSSDYPDLYDMRSGTRRAAADEALREAGFQVLSIPDHGAPFCTLVCLRSVDRRQHRAQSNRCSELENAVVELQRALAEARGRDDRAERALEDDPERLERFRDERRFINKVELKVSADLDELRSRYREMSTRAEQQQELLWALKQKLDVAHEILRSPSKRRSLAESLQRASGGQARQVAGKDGGGRRDGG